MSLQGKTIYLTGASGGIGKPLVSLLQQAGAQVTCHALETDGDLVTNLDSICQKLITTTPDILINLAGMMAFGFCETQPAQTLLEVNLLAPIRLTQAVLPAMKARGYGQVVHVSSMLAVIPLPHYSVYAASKAGLRAFSEALQRELADSGVAVSCLLPRAVKTPMNTGVAAQLQALTHTPLDSPEAVAGQIYRLLLKPQPEKRLGRPEKMFALLNALFPRWVDKGLLKQQRLGTQLLNNAE